MFFQEKFTPVKYFSIDRVFRNESLDATHLAEFHQVEGVVADRGLTLGHLMGTLREFFTKLGTRGGGHQGKGRGLGHPPDALLPPPGITKLRFKPAYNPYTEPSMEVFSYHEGEGALRGVGGLPVCFFFRWGGRLSLILCGIWGSA